MRYNYLILDDDTNNLKETLHALQGFSQFICIATSVTADDALNKVLDLAPDFVIITLNSKSKPQQDFFSLINNLHRYLNVLPYFIVLSDSKQYAYEALKAGVYDYLLIPIVTTELRKSLLKIQKKLALIHKIDNYVVEEPIEIEEHNTMEGKISKICIKSYGDYQFIDLDDIIYLKADNNTTDFYLKSGKQLTAYKTLKHYELNLPEFFYRVHNSYIVNSNHISRINTGKSLCYLDNNKVSISFSRTYKENIDRIIEVIAPEYL